jgi:hypothetical protein
MIFLIIGSCLRHILCSASSTNPPIGEVGYLYHLVEADYSSKVDFESQGQYFFNS